VTTSATHAPDAEHAITVHRLAKRYGRHDAVRDVSFTVRRGSVVGFLGPNGAGKTTTLRALLGLVQPTSGSAGFGGVRYRDLPHPSRHVGAMIDAAVGHPGRTARDHLRVLASAMEVPDARVAAVLDRVDLAGAAGRRIGGFSQGMRQRLGLAGALLGDPQVLVLDEPQNGLDPEGIRWLRETIHAFAADGRTVLLSSHVLAEVAQTVEEIVVIDAGRVVAHAPIGELIASTASGRATRVRTPHAALLVAALSAAGHASERLGPDELRVAGVDPAELGAIAAAAGVVLHELAPEAGDLETAFFDLTRTHDPLEVAP